MSRLLAALLVGILAGPARADLPPVPPADHPPRVLVEGQQLQLLPPLGGPPEVVTVPPARALYLDEQAWTYQLELRRWTELEVKVCKDQLDAAPPPGLKWIGGALVVGLVGGFFAARRLK